MKKFIFFLLACMVAAGIYTNLKPSEPATQEVAQQSISEPLTTATPMEATQFTDSCIHAVRTHPDTPDDASFNRITRELVEGKPGSLFLGSAVDSVSQGLIPVRCDQDGVNAKATIYL